MQTEELERHFVINRELGAVSGMGQLGRQVAHEGVEPLQLIIEIGEYLREETIQVAERDQQPAKLLLRRFLMLYEAGDAAIEDCVYLLVVLPAWVTTCLEPDGGEFCYVLRREDGGLQQLVMQRSRR